MRDFTKQEEVDDFVTSVDQLTDVSGSLALICKDSADLLERHYPGWMWAIQPFEFGAVIKIFSLRLSGEYGFMIRVPEIQNDPQRKLALEAGGQILERFGMPRGPYDRELVRYKARDIRGNLIPDITDKKPSEQKQDRDRVVTAAVKEGKLKFKAEDHTMPDGSVRRELSMQIGGNDDV